MKRMSGSRREVMKMWRERKKRWKLSQAGVGKRERELLLCFVQINLRRGKEQILIPSSCFISPLPSSH